MAELHIVCDRLRSPTPVQEHFVRKKVLSQRVRPRIFTVSKSKLSGMEVDQSSRSDAVMEAHNENSQNEDEEFWIADQISLEEVDQHGSHFGVPQGPSREAAPHESIGTRTYHFSASVGGKITEVAWGLWDRIPSARVKVMFRIRSKQNFRIICATLRCRLDHMTASLGHSGPSPKPRILSFHPSLLLASGEPKEEGTQIRKVFNFDPSIGVGGVNLHILSWSKEQTYIQHPGLETAGDDLEGGDDANIVCWTLSASEGAQTNHDVPVEFVIEHHGKDFFCDFEVSADLGILDRIFTLGRREPCVKRRTFTVQQSMVEFVEPTHT